MPDEPKNPAAVALGRLGGSKGGQARAQKLSAEQRSAIAKKASLTRWQQKRERDFEALLESQDYLDYLEDMERLEAEQNGIDS